MNVLRLFQRTSPSVLFLCMHKGGSTFIADELGPRLASELKLRHLRLDTQVIAGASVGDFPLPPTGTLVTRLYPHHLAQLVEQPPSAGLSFSNKQWIVLRRDPRDVLVSLYYAIRFSHDPDQVQNPAGWVALRERLRSMPRIEGMKLLVTRAPRTEFMLCSDWIARYPQALVTRYETMVTDYPLWSREVADYLQLPERKRRRIFGGLERSVQPPAREDPMSHKRRVLPGAWQEEFDAELESLFHREFGPKLLEAGYSW